MSDVESGQILVADHQGMYVFKMSGDVRLTLCIAFDDCIESLFSRNDFESVLFDLSDAENLDSTTLGLIAKAAIKCQSAGFAKPIVFSPNPAIQKLLVTMGLNEICSMVNKPIAELEDSEFTFLAKTINGDDETKIKDKVMESHLVLMELNESNRATFKDLIETLKVSDHPTHLNYSQ